MPCPSPVFAHVSNYGLTSGAINYPRTKSAVAALRHNIPAYRSFRIEFHTRIAFASAISVCALTFPQIKQKYDGYWWNYIGSVETGKYPRTIIGSQVGANRGSSGTCSHTYLFGMNSINFRKMMLDTYINACEDMFSNAQKNGNFEMPSKNCY